MNAKIFWDFMEMAFSSCANQVMESFFNSHKKRIDITPLWVKCLCLPFNFLTFEVFKEIRNVVGNFIEVDMSFLDLDTLYVACILVGINMVKGMPQNNSLYTSNFIYETIF